MWSCLHAQIAAATLLLLFCGSSAQNQPLDRECSLTDNFCAVQNSTLVIATPSNGTVLTTQENRISATEYDTSKDYVSFLVLYDEGSCPSVRTLKLLAGGSGYTSAPVIVFSGGGGRELKLPPLFQMVKLHR
jgi:hypothetical protein